MGTVSDVLKTLKDAVELSGRIDQRVIHLEQKLDTLTPSVQSLINLVQTDHLQLATAVRDASRTEGEVIQIREELTRLRERVAGLEKGEETLEERLVAKIQIASYRQASRHADEPTAFLKP